MRLRAKMDSFGSFQSPYRPQWDQSGPKNLPLIAISVLVGTVALTEAYTQDGGSDILKVFLNVLKAENDGKTALNHFKLLLVLGLGGFCLRECLTKYLTPQTGLTPQKIVVLGTIGLTGLCTVISGQSLVSQAFYSEPKPSYADAVVSWASWPPFVAFGVVAMALGLRQAVKTQLEVREEVEPSVNIKKPLIISALSCFFLIICKKRGSGGRIVASNELYVTQPALNDPLTIKSCLEHVPGAALTLGVLILIARKFFRGNVESTGFFYFKKTTTKPFIVQSRPFILGSIELSFSGLDTS